MIFTRNLPRHSVVNGQHGTVVSLLPAEKTVTVQLESGRSITVGKVVFSKHDRNSGRVMASRQQIPIKLAYAMTVHKSQGRTLSSVVVHCDEMRKPGTAVFNFYETCDPLLCCKT